MNSNIIVSNKIDKTVSNFVVNECHVLNRLYDRVIRLTEFHSERLLFFPIINTLSKCDFMGRGQLNVKVKGSS